MKKFYILLSALIFLTACGENTGGKNLQEAISDFDEQLEIPNDTGSSSSSSSIVEENVSSSGSSSSKAQEYYSKEGSLFDTDFKDGYICYVFENAYLVYLPGAWPRVSYWNGAYIRDNYKETIEYSCNSYSQTTNEDELGRVTCCNMKDPGTGESVYLEPPV